MRIIIEFDGPIFDVGESWYAAHVQAAHRVSWARLDRERFSRLIRKNGLNADAVPGAPGTKLAEYHRQFAGLLDTPEILRMLTARPGLVTTLTSLAKLGPIVLVTLGTEKLVRMELLRDAGASQYVEELESLNSDPCRRAAELSVLARQQTRALVVACSDSIIRAADQAELFTVGLTGGPFDETLLHRAGVRTVFRTLQAVAEELSRGGPALVQAGLLPEPAE
jgi:phosphoglycolate phosphatase-like HAD superfamily hydrolase